MSDPKRLAVLTTGRQDWGLLRPLCAALNDDDRLDLVLLVGGMALCPEFGDTIGEIRGLGFRVNAEFDFDVTRKGAAAQAAAAVELVAVTLRETRLDALVLLGDRFETAGAALAATIEGIPIVHLFGGEETEGAFDNSLRHAITKLSHLHFVAHDEYARRVVQMGEDPASVHVVGNLAADNISSLELPTLDQIQKDLGLEFARPIGLVTVHPTTLAHGGEDVEAIEVATAMTRFDATWIVTLPNADPGNNGIRSLFVALAEEQPNVFALSALGTERYLGLLGAADFAVGNSSSGLTEAPLLRTPTINVGDRQRGRIRCESIIDVSADSDEILEAVHLATSPQFRAGVESMILQFGDGTAARRICEVLSLWQPPNPPVKRFHRLPNSSMENL